MIDPNIWMSEDVAKLTILERILMIGMFSNADDYGKGRANASYIRSTVFPYDDIPLQEIEEGLEHISKFINITVYKVDKCQYYKFINWEKWQTVQKKQDSKVPEPVENDSLPSTESVQSELSLREEKRREEEEKKKGREENSNLSPTSDSPTPYTEIVDCYNRLCINLPRAVTITDKRKKSMKSRWHNYTDINMYYKLFKMAQDSDFLSGKNSKWTGCNFDWLINENNMVKVLEGNYENKKSKTGLDVLNELYQEDKEDGE